MSLEWREVHFPTTKGLSIRASFSINYQGVYTFYSAEVVDSEGYQIAENYNIDHAHMMGYAWPEMLYKLLSPIGYEYLVDYLDGCCDDEEDE